MPQQIKEWEAVVALIEKVLEVQADEISALRLENEELKMKLCRFKEAITHLQAND